MELFSDIVEAFSFPELVSQDRGKIDGHVIAVHLLKLVLFQYLQNFMVIIFNQNHLFLMLEIVVQLLMMEREDLNLHQLVVVLTNT